MARDYRIMYDPIYADIGVDAVFTLSGFHDPISARLVDKTAGVALPGGVEVETVVPLARVRAYELAGKGVIMEDLDGGTVAFSGKSWRIESTMPKPSPSGEGNGEIQLTLMELS